MSRYLSLISRRNHAISCLYYKAKKCHLFVTQSFSHARMVGFTTTTYDQTCDRTKVTRMIFASTTMKLFLNTCKYFLEVYVLSRLIVHRSLAIIFNRFCLWNIDSGLAKLSIQLQAVKIVDCYHPFFFHINMQRLPQQRKISQWTTLTCAYLCL